MTEVGSNAGMHTLTSLQHAGWKRHYQRVTELHINEFELRT